MEKKINEVNPIYFCFEAVWLWEKIKTLIHELAHSIWDDAKEIALQEVCVGQIQQAVEEYLNAPQQPIESIFDYHYATLPDYLIEQRAQALEEI